MAAQSQEAPPSEWKSQSLIGKVSASLQLPLEVPVAIETVSALRRALAQDCACALADLAWEISFYNAIWAKETTFMTQLLSDFIADFKYEI